MAGNVDNNLLSSLKSDVARKFGEMREALHTRELLLIRQLDAIARSHRCQEPGCGASLPKGLQLCPSRCVQFITDNESEILAALRSFGRFQLDNPHTFLKSEDYIAPTDDHEIMYKCLRDDMAEHEVDDATKHDAIVVDFARNKSLLSESAKLLNKSIVNITLREARELIKRAKPWRETKEEPETEVAGDLQKTSVNCKTKHNKSAEFNPQITISNCSGTISLRNVASLTIDCEESTPLDDSASLNKNVTLEQEKQPAVSNESQACREVVCNFYNRLLECIKTNELCELNSKSNEARKHAENLVPPNLVLKNFENLKIVLESRTGDEDAPPLRPVQIMQWLNEIVNETDQEPTTSTDILEHSRLKSSESF